MLIKKNYPQMKFVESVDILCYHTKQKDKMVLVILLIIMKLTHFSLSLKQNKIQLNC